jgi:hypothetical protein
MQHMQSLWVVISSDGCKKQRTERDRERNAYIPNEEKRKK